MYEPTKGSSYIPLPVALKSNKYAPVPKLPQADAGALCYLRRLLGNYGESGRIPAK